MEELKEVIRGLYMQVYNEVQLTVYEQLKFLFEHTAKLRIPDGIGTDRAATLEEKERFLLKGLEGLIEIQEDLVKKGEVK